MNLDEKFTQLFKGILIPAYIWQKKENKLVLIDYNNAVEENTDGQIEDYIGVEVEEFYKDQTIVLENLNRCLNEKKGFISEIEITHQFPREKKFVLFKFDFIPPNLVVVYENDITDNKLMKLELEKSEKKYNSLISYMTDVVWTKDREGNAIYISPNVVNILGFTPEEIIHDESEQIWFGRLHPDDVEKIKEAYLALFEKNIRFDVEYRIKRKDGEWIWLRDITDLIYEKDGVKYTDGVFFDITERKLAESKLRETEEKYKALVFNIPSVAWTTDYEGHTTFISPNIEKIYGFSPEEIYIGDEDEVWFGRIHPEDADRVRESFRALYEKNEVYDIEYRIKRKDGKWIWLHDTANIVYDKKGVLYADGVLSDVTDRKIAEIALKESEEKYRLITENVNDLILVINEENILEYVNERVFKNILGYLKEDLIGKSVIENIHPDDVNKCIAAIKKGIFEGDTSVKLRVNDKNGIYHMIEFSGGWFKDIHDFRKGFIVGRKIYEKKPSELKLDEE